MSIHSDAVSVFAQACDKPLPLAGKFHEFVKLTISTIQQGYYYYPQRIFCFCAIFIICELRILCIIFEDLYFWYQSVSNVFLSLLRIIFTHSNRVIGCCTFGKSYIMQVTYGVIYVNNLALSFSSQLFIDLIVL